MSQLLQKLGLMINIPKSDLCPARKRLFGFMVDSVSLSLYLPGDRISTIQKQVSQLRRSAEVSIRSAMRVLGHHSHRDRSLGQKPLQRPTTGHTEKLGSSSTKET